MYSTATAQPKFKLRAWPISCSGSLTLSQGTTVRSFFYPVGRWSKRARKWRKRLCPDAGEQGVTTRGAAPGEQLMPQSEEQRVGNTYLAWTGTCSCNPTAPCSSIGLCFMGDRRQPNTFGMVRAIFTTDLWVMTIVRPGLRWFCLVL